MSTVLEAAAEHIAVTMIQAAFAHLPAKRAAAALAMAKTEPISRMLRASILEAWQQGEMSGARRGRLALEQEMEDDWKPIAERVRQSAGAPSRVQLEHIRNEKCGGTEYKGGAVAAW